MKKQYNLKELYYLNFISTSNSIYLLLLKINVDAIDNIKENYLSKTKKSINIINIIDDKYGMTKLYKSKKRIELRFNKSVIHTSKTIKLY